MFQPRICLTSAASCICSADVAAAQVINDAVVDLFQSMLVDSLLTFFQVKCLFDHDMSTGEEVMLGQCELARTQLGLGAGKAVKPAASTNPTGSPNAKSGASASGDAPASATAEAEVTLIELDGEGDVVACTAVDGKVEMYRVKYVRMTLKSSMIQVCSMQLYPSQYACIHTYACLLSKLFVYKRASNRIPDFCSPAYHAFEVDVLHPAHSWLLRLTPQRLEH